MKLVTYGVQDLGEYLSVLTQLASNYGCSLISSDVKNSQSKLLMGTFTSTTPTSQDAQDLKQRLSQAMTLGAHRVQPRLAHLGWVERLLDRLSYVLMRALILMTARRY